MDSLTALNGEPDRKPGLPRAPWHGDRRLVLRVQRGNLGKVVQYAAIWGFIFIGAIVAVGLWTDIRQTVTPRQSVMMDGARVEVPQATDGHFYLTLEVNGAPIRFVVDTGATDLVLTRAGRRAGGDRHRRADLFGAGLHRQRNGQTAPVLLDTVALEGTADAAFGRS
jgi:aspartyl protease family protein